MRNLWWGLLVSCVLIGRGNGSPVRLDAAPAALRPPTGLSVLSPAPAEPPTITKIEVVGAPVQVYDHSQRVGQLPDGGGNEFSDGVLNAWREADGTVNLNMPCYEAYRLRGPDLLNLTLDRNKIYSATQSAGYIQENLYKNLDWMAGPYSVDGRNFYTLSHHEWYACLLDNDTNNGRWPGWAGLVGGLNSWVTSVNSMVSTDGGASWRHNDVGGNHTVAKAGYYWTGSAALANKIYLYADNRTGLQQITRMIKEGDYYYAMGNYYHRDFTRINPAAGVYQAPMDKEGIVLIRTNDFRDPNGWQAWTGGSNYEPLSNQNYKTFYPQQGGVTMPTWSPTFVYDTNAQAYILIFVPNITGSGVREPVCYMTTKSLANPSWSDYATIEGTQQLVTDPNGGPWVGFGGANYASIIDPSCSGFNFESTSSGRPWMFWSTAPGIYGRRDLRNDIFRVQLSISYGTVSQQPGTTVRVEAETMSLSNYVVEPDSYAGGGFASGGNYIRVPQGGMTGTATRAFAGADGTYDVYVAYFDENDGSSPFEFRLGGAIVDSWVANQDLGNASPGASSLVRRKVASARSVSNGTTIQVTATQNAGEWARVDYVEFVPAGTASGTYLSDLSWTTAVSSWGPVEKDRSNGESGAGDGHPLTLNGVTYAKGLGVHAYSELRYSLGGQYSTFLSDVGVDDEWDPNGSVLFQVWADGEKLFDSGVMTGSSATKTVNVSVAGKNELRLIVTDGGDGAGYDHADWAGARLTAGPSPSGDKFHHGDHVAVINGAHNIRSAPNSALPVLAQVPEGAQGTITGGPIADQNPAGPSGIGLFYQVTWDNSGYPTGWIYDVTLALTSPPATSGVTILQATPSNPSAAAGQSFSLTYHWQGGPTAAAETVFVHFGEYVISDDHVPSPATTAWSGTTSYTRTIAVPSGLAPGNYPIMAGLFTSTVRLALTPGPGVTPDGALRYQIGTLTVR